MKIKFMIHRSRNSFLREKESFKKIVSFYQEKYLDLKFIDKKIRFSIQKGSATIDFDFGYYHMDKRNFKKYDHIISTGLFAIFNPAIAPGDMILPTETTQVNINARRTRVTINPVASRFNNYMKKILVELKKYESKINKKDVETFIYKAFKELREYKIHSIKDMPIHQKGKIITCNTIFIPSELNKAKSHIKRAKKKCAEKKEINNLKEYLEKNTDGLNCETKGMVENVGEKLSMLSWGFDKPYQLTELTTDLRNERNYHKIIPTFNLAQKTYFYFLLIGLLIEDDFKL